MKRSLYWHGKIGLDLRDDGPTEDERRFMMANAHDQLPVEWTLPDDFFEFSHFMRVIREVDMTSSPGYPYRTHYPTNSAFFDCVDGKPSLQRVWEIWGMVLLQVQERRADPIYLFVKPEPHKESKKGRKRLISSVSIIDQLIDQMLFGEFNRWVIDDAAYGPIKAGWSARAGGWKTMPMEGISIDKKAWDWTVKTWLMEFCLAFRKETLRGPFKDRWYDLASWRYRMLHCEAEFALPSGEIRKQGKPGVMKSGCVNTIVDNSLMQMFLHFRLCYMLGIEPGWIWCLGDDTRQSVVDRLREYLDLMAQFCHVKEWTLACEFAGCRFAGGRVVNPLYLGKHAFKLLYCAPNVQEDVARSYSLDYHRSQQRPGIEPILKCLGPLLPEDLRDLLWDGEV